MTFFTRRCQNTFDAAISNVVVVSRHRRTLKTTFKKRPPPLCTRLRSTTALKKSVEGAEKDDDDDARKPQPEPEAWEYKYLYDGACPVCRSLKAGLEGTTECGKSTNSCLTERKRAAVRRWFSRRHLFLSLSLSLCVCVCFACADKTPSLLFFSFEQVRAKAKARSIT